MLKSTVIGIAGSLVIVVSGCGNQDPTPEPGASTVESREQGTSAGWVLASLPEGDISITEAKSNAKEGDEVVIRGRIGGRRTPMSSDSPVFTVVDLGLEYCGQTTNDQCSAPWDYCCETPATIASNTATVQVEGDAINLVESGFSPLDEVVLVGVVGPRPDDKVLTIKATGVYRVGG